MLLVCGRALACFSLSLLILFPRLLLLALFLVFLATLVSHGVSVIVAAQGGARAYQERDYRHTLKLLSAEVQTDGGTTGSWPVLFLRRDVMKYTTNPSAAPRPAPIA